MVNSSSSMHTPKTLRSGLRMSIISYLFSLPYSLFFYDFFKMLAGSNVRIKLFSFFFERFMIYRLHSWAAFPLILRTEVPNGKAILALCSTYCEGSGLLPTRWAFTCWFYGSEGSCCSLRP